MPDQPPAVTCLFHQLGAHVLAVLIIGTTPLSAGESTPPKTSEIISPTLATPTSLGEKWENLGRLYQSDSNPILQEFWLLGRYHGQYHWSDGSAGQNEAFETRRHRVGFQARLFEKLSLHAQMVSGSNFEPFYNGFTELWVQWAFSEQVTLTIGQQKHRFTHDRNVSSRYINYLERSMMTNMFGADYTPAITLLGRIDKLTYYTGLFSNATGTDMGEAFSDFNSGYSFLAAAYYDLGKSLGTDTANLYFSYLHSDANDNATNKIGLPGQGFTFGLGSENGDAVALNFQPSYFITDNLQIAGRYQLAGSNNPKGLNPQLRYERPAGLSSGDLYQAAYIGLNYHIAKHRLKLMTGLEYATMGGEDVWTASTMVRFFFGPHSGGPFPMNQMQNGHFFHHD